MASQRILGLGGTIFLCAFCGSRAELPRIDAPSGLVQTPSTTGCLVSELVRAEPPRDPNADPFGPGPWYINADRSIWAGWDAGHLVSGPKGNKVLWIRPQGTDLIVTGRRLDSDDAMPHRVEIPCCYPNGFQASALYLPTSGCWEVTARAGGRKLQLVLAVS